MTRIQEKVKDLIEVVKYEHVLDFLAEPAKTLDGYHYTPITSELMVNWLDAISAVEGGRGVAKALAGYRGVGKSHFLATLGALLAQPELRAKVSDSHVFARLHHLKRQNYPVAYVRRGTKKTFTEELITAICTTLNLSPDEVESDIESLIKRAAKSAGELPFVIIVDTDLERDVRVSREDGVLLGELARFAKAHRVFIGVALDDDITEADGINSAIAQTYTIDYLDQAHLYQIVDSHIFPKDRRAAPLIQSLYNEFRNNLQTFRWSEERFSSLYPLHPSILEVAPFVRFYAPAFALLRFASKAGERILGRPANSLISLDEVFDNVEGALRKSEDLKPAFEVYDQILKDVISEIPIMERLQSKLILKAMFILSLDGNGTTAAEIREAMLIYDEAEPNGKAGVTDQFLETIVSKFPDGIWRKEDSNGETRFGIKIGGKDDLNSTLESIATGVSDEVIPKVLRWLAKDAFSDWKRDSVPKTDFVDSIASEFTWQETIRRANLVWNWGDVPTEKVSKGSLDSETVDAQIFINSGNVAFPNADDINSGCLVEWQSAPLTEEEKGTLKRFFILLNDESLRQKFADQVRAAGNIHRVAVEKIWHRSLFTDASVSINGEKYEMPQDARGASLLSQSISAVVKPFFDRQYPDHPTFERSLGIKEVTSLVSDLFSGARGNSAEVQNLALACAEPLGLVETVRDEYVLADGSTLLQLPLAKKVLAILDEKSDQTVSLGDVYGRLCKKPYGLSREAQQLLLAALVARKCVEFVTTKGNRINHRSLDLKIVWEDIAGIAAPFVVAHDHEKLTGWARALTENDDLESYATDGGRAVLTEALEAWLVNWNKTRVLDQFGELPDEILNTKIWYVSIRVEKTFGVIKRKIESFLDESITLEDTLESVAEKFSDSMNELSERKKDLRVLIDFIEGAEKRKQIWSYLAICEATQDESIEGFRANLLRLISEGYDSPSNKGNQEMNSVWETFQQKFSEHFTVRHNAVMNSQQLRREFDEILKSDEWWEFACLSKLSVFNASHWHKALQTIKSFRALECKFDVKTNLKTYPFCACSFNLTKMSELGTLSGSLHQTMRIGRQSYRKTLFTIAGFLNDRIGEVIENDKNEDLKTEAEKIILLLRNRKTDVFSSTQLSIIYSAMFSATTSTSIDVSIPDKSGLFTSEELRASLNGWLDELPNEPILLKV